MFDHHGVEAMLLFFLCNFGGAENLIFSFSFRLGTPWGRKKKQVIIIIILPSLSLRPQGTAGRRQESIQDQKYHIKDLKYMYVGRWQQFS